MSWRATSAFYFFESYKASNLVTESKLLGMLYPAPQNETTQMPIVLAIDQHQRLHSAIQGGSSASVPPDYLCTPLRILVRPSHRHCQINATALKHSDFCKPLSHISQMTALNDVDCAQYSSVQAAPIGFIHLSRLPWSLSVRLEPHLHRSCYLQLPLPTPLKILQMRL
jgi:hypothetical protein